MTGFGNLDPLPMWGRKVCAWCGAELGQVEGLPPASVSHGMCDGCALRQLEQLREDEVHATASMRVPAELLEGVPSTALQEQVALELHKRLTADFARELLHGSGGAEPRGLTGGTNP